MSQLKHEYLMKSSTDLSRVITAPLKVEHSFNSVLRQKKLNMLLWIFMYCLICHYLIRASVYVSFSWVELAGPYLKEF